MVWAWNPRNEHIQKCPFWAFRFLCLIYQVQHFASCLNSIAFMILHAMLTESFIYTLGRSGPSGGSCCAVTESWLLLQQGRSRGLRCRSVNLWSMPKATLCCFRDGLLYVRLLTFMSACPNQGPHVWLANVAHGFQPPPKCPALMAQGYHHNGSFAHGDWSYIETTMVLNGPPLVMLG